MADPPGSSDRTEFVIDVLGITKRLLKEGALSSVQLPWNGRDILAFEGDTVLGFVLVYSSIRDLLDKWQTDSDAVIESHRLNLRLAQSKAWNTYTVFLATETASESQGFMLNLVEEDLVGTRKIARGGISSTESVRNAVLSLLPIQNAPRLEAVDMKDEITIRTSEMPPHIVAAFLSTAPETAILQFLGD